MSKQLIVIGGGAAGFFCAVNAARMSPALKVILLEKSGKLLSKVKVSGGGRCNVTHQCFDFEEMSKHYPRGRHFVKKAFRQFFTTGTIEWFGERGVKLKAEKDGRMFPVTDSSQTIIDCLMKEADEYGVEIRMNSEVKNIVYQDGKFHLELAGTIATGVQLLTSDYVTIASGGYPKSSMFGWLKKTGHSIEEPVPSLFTFNLPGNPLTQLMGVSVEKATVKITGTKLAEEGPVLITHWGLSGPAILRLSAWGARELAVCNWQFTVIISWLQGFKEHTLKERFQQFRYERASQKVMNKNHFGLPQRLWEFLVQQSGINDSIRWADLPAKEQNRLIKNLCGFECAVKGKTTFKEEFVTAGGIKLNEVDASTMSSKKISNLFFAGEVVDVDGITGGFNFQHAWTSGYVAAKSISSLAG